MTLAGNYAFRTEQAGATYLDNWGIVSETGSETVSNFQVTGPVHNVTQDIRYLTIQMAIDAALDGDEIVLDPEGYTGPGDCDIDFEGKAITVRSTHPEGPIRRQRDDHRLPRRDGSPTPRFCVSQQRRSRLDP